MFLEETLNHTVKKGSIEIICGSMFSGKTEELLRRLKRAQFAKLKIVVIKPEIDTRYDDTQVVSHDLNKVESKTVKSPNEILNLANDSKVVAIDEAQFFNDDLIVVCNKLANKGKRVIIAGLDMDFLGRPFGIMPQLLAIAEYVTKVHAICVECGEIANYSFRLTNNNDQIQLGQKDEYKPLCRECFSDKF